MEGRRGALDLSEEIELCGKLRNDIGKALKTDAHNAAKAQSECEEGKALETLIENEALHLEEGVASAESSFLHATSSIEKIEVATAHLHETNSVLSRQLDKSLQLIDESTEAFEGLRRRHLSFCQVQEEAHKRMTSVEALLRSIMNGEEQTRGLKTELQTLKSTLEVLERAKGELLPVLESCQEAFDCVKMEYERSKRNNAQHLELIDRCREEEEQMKARNWTQTMTQLRDAHTELCARKVALEAEVARVHSAVTADVQLAAQQQSEVEEEHGRCSSLLEGKKLARQEQEQKLNLLKGEMQEATEEMYSTMERMKELRRQDADLGRNKQKAMEMLANEREVLAELKKREKCVIEVRAAQQKAAALTESLQREEKKLIGLCGMLEMARMEQTEMDALRENEKSILEEALEVLRNSEERADETRAAGEELKGLIDDLEAVLTEQKEVTHNLISSRSRVDLQLKSADIAEAHLSELRHTLAAHAIQIKERESQREEDEALIKHMQGEASQRAFELKKLEGEHVAIRRNIEELKGRSAQNQDNGTENQVESQAEVLRIRKDLQTKYEAACAQVRAECQCQYTAMLNQTVKDEEGRLAEEKRIKMGEISALVQRTIGRMAELNANESLRD